MIPEGTAQQPLERLFAFAGAEFTPACSLPHAQESTQKLRENQNRKTSVSGKSPPSEIK